MASLLLPIALLPIALALPPRAGPPVPLAGVGIDTPAPPGTAEDCGLQDGVVPDYALVDICPGSATSGQTVARGDFPGNVHLMYFALPTCGVCQGHVQQLQQLWNDYGETWEDDVRLHIIALADGESGIPDLTEGVTLPVLQDTTEAAVQAQYGAQKWYFYLVDREGRVRWIHYKLDLYGGRDRMIAEIETLRAEEAP